MPNSFESSASDRIAIPDNNQFGWMGMDSHQAHTHMVFLSVLTPLSPSCFTLPCLSVRLPLATFVLCEIRKAVSVVNIQEELLPKSLQWVSFRVTYVHTRPCERRAAVAPNTRQQHCPGRHSCIFIFCQLTWLFDKSGGAREESEWKRVPVASQPASQTHSGWL